MLLAGIHFSELLPQRFRSALFLLRVQATIARLAHKMPAIGVANWQNNPRRMDGTIGGRAGVCVSQRNAIHSACGQGAFRLTELVCVCVAAQCNPFGAWPMSLRWEFVALASAAGVSLI